MSFDLSQYEANFKEVQHEVPEDDFSEVPDGTYEVEVEKCYLDMTKTDPKPVLKWWLRIVGPTRAGAVLFKNNFFHSSNMVKWLHIDLQKIGLKLSNLSELESRLEDVIGKLVKVQKKTNGDFYSVYFQKELEPRSNSNSDDLPF